MRIKMLYFGMLKDLLGCECEELQLEAGARVEDAVRVLRGRASKLYALEQADRIWASLALAVNEEYAALETPLNDGDKVALLPPVSGGASKLQQEQL